MKEDSVLTPNAGAVDAASTGTAINAAARPDVTSDDVLAAIMNALDENKAEEVVQIDLRGKTSVCDHMVICSGRSSRQVAALAEKITESLKTDLGIYAKTEGKETGDWVLIDSGDVLVHIFRPEVREFYQLEKMWVPMAQGAAPTGV